MSNEGVDHMDIDLCVKEMPDFLIQRMKDDRKDATKSTTVT